MVLKRTLFLERSEHSVRWLDDAVINTLLLKVLDTHSSQFQTLYRRNVSRFKWWRVQMEAVE